MSGTPLERLGEAALVALRLAGEQWPRGLLAGTPVPAGWLGLVQHADGRRRVVPAGDEPRAGRGDTLVLVRQGALPVPLAAEELPTADGHAAAVRVELLLRCPPRDGELAALARRLLDSGALELPALAERVATAGAAAALRAFVRGAPAAALVEQDQRGPLLAALHAALQRFLFDNGLELDGLGAVEIASATLADERTRQRATAARLATIAARQQVEAAGAAAVRRRLDDLGGLLAKLQAAAGAATDLRWHELLPALAPDERLQLLENLWRITPDCTVATAIVVVAGNECLWLDPAAPEEPARRALLDDTLGPLRSVRYAAKQDALLIGAARGVWVVGAADGAVRGAFAVPGAAAPRTGFNSAAWIGDALYATHSELGCWAWPVERPAAATPLLQPVGGVPRTVRAAAVTPRGRLAFAADDIVHLYDPVDEQRELLGPVGAPIQALTVLDERLYAGTADGQLLQIELRPVGAWLRVHRATGALESVQARRWNDLVELIIPAGDAGVCGVFGEEAAVTRLLEARWPVRRAWACDDVVVALSDARDRLVVLNANWPGRAVREVPVGRWTGRSVQDAALVTRRA